MSDAFRCRCLVGCGQRATQEDMLCDVCRDSRHAHLSLNGDDLGPMHIDEWKPRVVAHMEVMK